MCAGMVVGLISWVRVLDIWATPKPSRPVLEFGKDRGRGFYLCTLVVAVDMEVLWWKHS